MGSPTQRALLITLSISRWGTSTAHRHWKPHLRHNPQYDAITSIQKRIRTFHYQNTFAWTYDGPRLLPVKNYAHYMRGICEGQAEHNEVVSRFLDHFDTIKDAARRQRLRPLKDPTEDLKQSFYVETIVGPVPEGHQFQPPIPPHAKRALQNDIDRRTANAFQAAHQVLWGRLRVLDQRVQRILKDPHLLQDPNLRTMRDALRRLDRLTLIDDGHFEALRSALLDTLDVMIPAPRSPRGNAPVRNR